MRSVRTTLSLDPDVAQRLLQELAAGKKSFKEVVNERLRLGFELKKAAQKTRFCVQPHSSDYQPGIAPAKFNQLVDEFQADEFIAKSRSR